MNSVQPIDLAKFQASACPGTSPFATRWMARSITHHLFAIQQTHNVLPVQFSVFQLMQPLMLRPGFWQRRDTSD